MTIGGSAVYISIACGYAKAGQVLTGYGRASVFEMI
jgi:hypothetical protein